MSLLAGAVDAAPSDGSKLKPYLDTLASLVPADILAAAAVFTAVFSNSTRDAATNTDKLTVTDPASLKAAFYGLVILAPVLWLIGNTKALQDFTGFKRGDLLRMFIPSIAFVGWAMVQRPSPLFDSAISISDGKKTLIVVFGGIVLGAIATRLSLKKPAAGGS